MKRSPRSIVLLPNSSAVAALNPARLDQSAQAALKELLAEGDSAHTVSSYRSALRYWNAWFPLRYGQPITLPVPPAAVLQFVLDHAPRRRAEGLRFELPPPIDAELMRVGCKQRLGPLSLATIAHRLSVLSKLHTMRRQPNPCHDPALRELMLKTRRAFAKRGELSRGKPALTREPLEALLTTCDESLAGKRDRALLLFAWATGGRRRSEVTAATMTNVARNGDGSYTYMLGRSKTNAAASLRPNDAKPLVGRAAVALTEWLIASVITDGAIFRRVRKGTTVAEPLSAGSVRLIVKRRCLLAGLDPNYSAHSLRSGFITEAGRRNVPFGEALALSGHASVATAMRYFRAGSALTERAGRLLDEPFGNPES